MNIHPHLTRRRMLQTVSAGFGYTALSALAAENAGSLKPKASHFPAKAKRVIFMFMSGAPSHVDMFDYKPELAKRDGQEVAYGRAQSKLLKSPWEFKQRGQSGLWISDLMPHLAEHADELCILNGMTTPIASHTGGVPMMHTGNFQTVRPSMGAWTLYGLGTENQDLPGFLAMNPLSNLGNHNHGSAFLPASMQATMIRAANGESMPNLTPPHQNDAQQRRQLELLSAFNHERLQKDVVNNELEGLIYSYELAFRMQSSIPGLMDLTKEKPTTLKSYGIGNRTTDAFGRQCLLARCFAEAGVRFIEIGTDGWDHHSSLKKRLGDSAAEIDQPIAALIADLKARDMLKDTLLIWGGEFGRTPHSQLSGGRDHNITGFTMWMAGGGVKAGHRHGATDEIGAKAVEGKMTVHDLHATTLHLLGLDHEKLSYRYSGRDFRLTDSKGNVVKEIIA
jgi:Protein of unknown function (DUF1501)